MKKKVLIPVFLSAMALPVAFMQSPTPAFADMFGEANNKANYVAYASEVGAQLAN